MRHPTGIVVDEIVLHILDPAGTFIPSERPIKLNGNEKLHAYFADHITTCLSTPSAKASRFKSFEPESPSGICKAMLEGETDLTTGAQSLAEKLFNILANDRRISAGDLAICFYRATNYPGEQFLALLKINPSEVYQHRIREENALRFVDFIPANQPLFAKREALQKAAFIRSRSDDTNYDMLLLDKQIPDIAEFFSKTFLNVEDAFDATQRTKNLYRAIINAHNEVRSSLTPSQNHAYDAAVTAAFESEKVNAEEFAAGLPVPDEAKNVLRKHLDASIPDHAFALDRNVALGMLKSRRFSGDHGLKVEVRRNAYADVIQSIELVEDDPSRPQPYHRIVIYAENWHELK